jgi:hypothetical protein
VRGRALGAVLAISMLAAGCGGSSSTTTVTVHSTTTVGSTVVSTGDGSGGGSTTASSSKAQNVVATATVKQALLAAGAAMHHLPASDYTGLQKGLTYYAFVPSTDTHWAGAALIASTSSQEAQVGDQDDGAYLDFKRVGSGTWRAYPGGLPGTGSFKCMVAIPPSVIALWGWASGACHPSSD